MAEVEPIKYDVAFSFLAPDESVAHAIRSHLGSGITSFIYSERQAELVGADGVEQFSAVFRGQATLAVVLHRQGWGETKWTRLEATAIKEHCLENGWDAVLAVALDASQPPKWLPSTQLWHDHARYGDIGAAVVIRERLRRLGGAVRDETLVERAQRLGEERRFEKDRKAFLDSHDGVAAANEAATELRRVLEANVKEVAAAEDIHHLRFYPERSAPEVCWITTDRQCLLVAWDRGMYSNTLEGSQLRLEEYGSPKTVGLQRSDLRASTVWHFDVERSGKGVWAEEAGRGRRLSTDRLAQELIEELLRLATGPGQSPR